MGGAGFAASAGLGSFWTPEAESLSLLLSLVLGHSLGSSVILVPTAGFLVIVPGTLPKPLAMWKLRQMVGASLPACMGSHLILFPVPLSLLC